MPSWQSVVFNQLLHRVSKKHLGQQQDPLKLRPVVAAGDKMGRFNRPPGLKVTAAYLGGVPCDWLDVPRAKPNKILLYFHGGGFCFKSPRLHSALVGQLCSQAGFRGLMVDYRLAPESPFPAAVEDCFSVYRFLIESNVDPQSIVIGGDSAGGNLALSTLLLAREHRLPQPAAAVLMSPATDMSMSGMSMLEKQNQDPLFHLGTLLMMRNSYLAGAHPNDPLASPFLAELDGLAPLMIQVGEHEMLLEDSTRLAEKAQRQGVDVELKIWQGMPHVFPAFSFLPEARKAQRQMAQFIGQRVQ